MMNGWGMGDGWGMGSHWIWSILMLVLLVLTIAALVKYLMK